MSIDTKNLFRLRLSDIQGGLSNVEMARKCGLNTQDIQRYSKGLASPTIEKLALIASAFSVSADWLIGIADTKTSRQTDLGAKQRVIELKAAATQVCADADSLLKSIISLEKVAK